MLDGGVGALALAPVSESIPELPEAQVFMHERAVAVAISGFDYEYSGALTGRYDANTDPLLFGFWAYELTPDNIIWGAFVDGLSVSKTPAASIPTMGSARYLGETLAVFENTSDIYQQREDVFGMATADVSLVVDFVSSTVGGSINNFMVGGESVYGAVTLGAAEIDRTVDGGFFKGTTSVPDPGGEDIKGEWGGQFFGERYEHIGGTWGASTDDGAFSAAGAFSATMRPSKE